jgi:hypothetical protein
VVRPGGWSDPTPPCSRLVCRLPCPYRRAGGGAERAIRPLCSLVCAGTSTRRDLRCKVSRSRRVCPASQPTCSRTHASPALGRRHLIGAMVNTRSISSSASAAAPSPPRQLPPRHPAPCSRRPRGAAARGQRLAGGRACARRSARRREAVSGGVRSPCRGGRSSCGRPLGREPMRRGRRQGGPVGWPRRAHCGALMRRPDRCGDRCHHCCLAVAPYMWVLATHGANGERQQWYWCKVALWMTFPRPF